MHARASVLQRAVADWVLGRLLPETVGERATTALADGCDDPTLAILATEPMTRAEIDDLLPALLRRHDLHRPSDAEALKTLVDDLAWQILHTDLDPIHAGHLLDAFSANEDESPTFYSEIDPIVFPALHPGPQLDQTRQTIRDEAAAFLARGGLSVST